MIAICEPPTQADPTGRVYVYYFDRTHFTASVVKDAGAVEYNPVLLHVVEEVGIGDTIAVHAIDANSSAFVVSDNSNVVGQVMKVEHVDIPDPEPPSTSASGWQPVENAVTLLALMHPEEDQSGTIVATGYAQGVIALSTYNSTSDGSLDRIHVLSFCDPGELLHRAAYDSLGVTCSDCPYGARSMGGRSTRCVDCSGAEAGVNDELLDVDGAARGCPPEASPSGGTNFSAILQDFAGTLDHGRHYRVSVRASNLAGTLNSHESQDFVVDHTVTDA